MSDAIVTVSGEITSIKRFDSGWCIANVYPDDAEPEPTEAPKNKNKMSVGVRDITLVGTLPTVTEGMNLKVKAKRSVHEKYGVQYKITEFISCGYSTLEGLQRYIAGPEFPDVGDITAEAIVSHFGEKVIEILDKDPELVMEVSGASHTRLRRVADLWKEARQSQLGLLELVKLGITPHLSNRIIKHFGKENIVSILEDNPYRLIEIRGIGFNRADEIAMRYGKILPDSPRRIEAALVYVLDEFSGQGHCYMNISRLIATTCDLINVSQEQTTRAIDVARKNGDIVIEATSVYSAEMHNAEVEVARELMGLMKYAQGKVHYKSHEEVKADLKSLNVFPDNFEFDSLQLQAIMTALNERVCVITGGPGTGKTTITKAIVALLDHHNYAYNLCSPTGRAAKRLSESSGKRAQTIHKLLGWSHEAGTFQYNVSNPLQTDVMLIDEFSMVDLKLFRDVLRALESNDRMIFVGDSNQLPSVGAGNVLRDIIASEAIPVVQLMHVFRQASGNTIVTVAHEILRGIVPELPTPKGAQGKNCMMVDIGDDVDKMRNYILQIVTKEITKLSDDKGNKYSGKDVQILTPRRTASYSVEEMNPWMQEALNPEKKGVDQIKDGHRVLRVGDRVMQTKNNYNKGDNGVFNGDIGYIVSVKMTANDGPEIMVRYPDMVNTISYGDDDLEQIQHAWVSTVHKAQGSEIPIVILVMQRCHSIMLQRNLLYTGLTRAKKICIIIGDSSAFAIAVNNNKEIRRNTGLMDRLQALA